MILKEECFPDIGFDDSVLENGELINNNLVFTVTLWNLDTVIISYNEVDFFNASLGDRGFHPYQIEGEEKLNFLSKLYVSNLCDSYKFFIVNDFSNNTFFKILAKDVTLTRRIKFKP